MKYKKSVRFFFTPAPNSQSARVSIIDSLVSSLPGTYLCTHNIDTCQVNYILSKQYMHIVLKVIVQKAL